MEMITSLFAILLQSKVYGAGYPSLPLMSVEEFYDQKYKEEVEQR